MALAWRAVYARIGTAASPIWTCIRVTEPAPPAITQADSRAVIAAAEISGAAAARASSARRRGARAGDTGGAGAGAVAVMRCPRAGRGRDGPDPGAGADARSGTAAAAGCWSPRSAELADMATPANSGLRYPRAASGMATRL